MSFSVVSLGSLCDFLYGDGLPESQRRGGGFAVYGSNGVVGWHDRAITKGPTIIIGRKGSIGEIHRSNLPCWPIDTTYYIEATKRPCDLTWLYYALIALDLTKLNKSAAVPGLNRDDAYEKEIVYPPLPEQQRIAAILARADRLRRLRRYALELSEGYLQAVFVEMFGDPVRNLALRLEPLGELCIKITDGTHVTPKYLPAGVPFLSVKNLTKDPGTIDFSDVKYISRDEHEKISKACDVRRGDILYTKVGTYGIAQIVDTDIEFSIFVSVAMLRPDRHRIDPKYLEAALRTAFIKRQADSLVSGIGVPDLHLREIKTIQVPVPPITDQHRFVEIIRKHERLRAQQREAARQAEQLFGALLDRAFRGEL